jgi:hypothetical protein
MEGLLWNVPLRSGGTKQQNFSDTLEWLWKADRSKFACANDLYYLCHPKRGALRSARTSQQSDQLLERGVSRTP